MPTGGIYIHVPYCSQKCLYCDFYSGGARIADWEAYTSALVNELTVRKCELPEGALTLYIGGGTPSLIPISELEKLMAALHKAFKKSDFTEFTLEANPENVTPEKCEAWKSFGVDRISLGVQTLNDKELKAIGRIHDKKRALEAIDLLKKYFQNISVDLIYGLPFQTVKSYQASLMSLIDFEPSHISLYSLMLENGTAMTQLVEKGRIQLPSEEEWMEMDGFSNSYLRDKGYHRYEISNYSLPGYESRHNSGYWLGRPYLGLGPAAHSYDGKNTRRSNPHDIKGYIKYYGYEEREFQGKQFYEEEHLNSRELCEEMIMTRLRMARGLDIEEFGYKFGAQAQKSLLQKSLSYIAKNLLKEENGYLSFTESGFAVSDSVIVGLM